MLVHSQDGTSWAIAETPVKDDKISDINVFKGKALITTTSRTAYYSQDLVSWQPVASDWNLGRIVAVNDRCYIFGHIQKDGLFYLRSSDGLTWTRHHTDIHPVSPLRAMIGTSTGVLGVGDGGLILTSRDFST